MNKFSSIFGQILTLFPRLRFEAFVQETKAAKHSKGFSCPPRRIRCYAFLPTWSRPLIAGNLWWIGDLSRQS